MNRISLLLVSLAYTLFAGAQTFDREKLNRYFDLLEANHKFMGSVSVFREGKEIYSYSVGLADVEARIPNNSDMQYKIGSISKPFTAAMVFRAIEAGKLKLTDCLSSFFPMIDNAEKITISQLLQHRSGIHNYTEDEFVEWSYLPKTQDQMIELIRKGGSEFAPDSKMEYSNSNYVLLSFILEKIYKRSYGTLLQKQIAKPIGLKQTQFGKKLNPGQLRCYSYAFFDRWRIERDTDPSVTLGAGGITATPSDLNRFADALFSGKVVSFESLTEMERMQDGCGKGLFPIPYYNKKGFGHSGRIDGFNSIWIYFPEDKLSYALTSNGANFVINDITLAVLAAVYNNPYSLPQFGVKALTDADLECYCGVYATDSLPMKITVTRNNGVLMAQATGQSAFELTPTGEHSFQFLMAGIEIEFNPETKSMVLRQGGGCYVMKKE